MHKDILIQLWEILRASCPEVPIVWVTFGIFFLSIYWLLSLFKNKL